jgi:hypothetical protein
VQSLRHANGDTLLPFSISTLYTMHGQGIGVIRYGVTCAQPVKRKQNRGPSPGNRTDQSPQPDSLGIPRYSQEDKACCAGRWDFLLLH